MGRTAGRKPETVQKFPEHSGNGLAWAAAQSGVPGPRLCSLAVLVGNGCAAPTLVAGQGALGEVLGKCWHFSIVTTFLIYLLLCARPPLSPVLCFWGSVSAASRDGQEPQLMLPPAVLRCPSQPRRA